MLLKPQNLGSNPSQPRQSEATAPIKQTTQSVGEGRRNALLGETEGASPLGISGSDPQPPFKPPPSTDSAKALPQQQPIITSAKRSNCSNYSAGQMA